ncbi:hypothetical protein CBR_g8702 [Chara braunii]|uniref:Uncharacterized protein n=1 Tax=Chara braunii TaxID=69332 RepID=A0A388KMK4_CHABU|nr:hypothetical protein CBR_g8702 [Chara braunii]|eukprot:GBG71280.1 hypothetical protein CBR_g8702 [Chara braunii]
MKCRNKLVECVLYLILSHSSSGISALTSLIVVQQVVGSRELEMADSQGKIGVEELASLQGMRDWERDSLPKVEIDFFKGYHVSDFLEKFGQIAAHCKWNKEQLLKEVVKYIHVSLQGEVSGLIRRAGTSWNRFYDDMWNKYRLGEEQLTKDDVEKIDRYSYVSVGHFLAEYERASRKVWALSEHDKCFVFLMNFTNAEQRDLIRGTEGRLVWDKIRENLEQEDFDQYLCHTLRKTRKRKKALGSEKSENDPAGGTSDAKKDESKKDAKITRRNHRWSREKKSESGDERKAIQAKVRIVATHTCERTLDAPSEKGIEEQRVWGGAGITPLHAAFDLNKECDDKGPSPVIGRTGRRNRRGRERCEFLEAAGWRGRRQSRGTILAFHPYKVSGLEVLDGELGGVERGSVEVVIGGGLSGVVMEKEGAGGSGRGLVMGVEESIMVKHAREEVSKGHVGFVGEGGGKVFVAYSFDAGDEHAVGNDGVGEVVSEGADVLDEAVRGTGLAEVAKLFKVVVNGFLGAEGGSEEGGPLEEGVAWSSGGSAVASFSHPPFGCIAEEAGGGNGEPVGKGHVVELKRAARVPL